MSFKRNNFYGIFDVQVAAKSLLGVNDFTFLGHYETVIADCISLGFEPGTLYARARLQALTNARTEDGNLTPAVAKELEDARLALVKSAGL